MQIYEDYEKSHLPSFSSSFLDKPSDNIIHSKLHGKIVFYSSTNKKYAIKAYSLENEKTLNYAVTDLSLMVRCNHPHIMKIESVHLSTKTIFFQTNGVESTLYSFIGEKSHASQKDLWMNESLSALHYLHERDIIHRDITPWSILIKDGHVLFSSFGSAETMTQNRGARAIIHNLYYTPPEIVSAFQENPLLVDYHASSDIWSLGATLYILWSGKTLVSDILEEPDDIIDYFEDWSFPIDSHYPKELTSMLELNPSNRPIIQDLIAEKSKERLGIYKRECLFKESTKNEDILWWLLGISIKISLHPRIFHLSVWYCDVLSHTMRISKLDALICLRIASRIEQNNSPVPPSQEWFLVSQMHISIEEEIAVLKSLKFDLVYSLPYDFLLKSCQENECVPVLAEAILTCAIMLPVRHVVRPSLLARICLNLASKAYNVPMEDYNKIYSKKLLWELEMIPLEVRKTLSLEYFNSDNGIDAIKGFLLKNL